MGACCLLDDQRLWPDIMESMILQKMVGACVVHAAQNVPFELFHKQVQNACERFLKLLHTFLNHIMEFNRNNVILKMKYD